MPFDLRGYARFLHGWLFRLPWTRRRVLVTVAFMLLHPPLALATMMCLALDRLIFPGYRTRPITAPVFIIGNFRSGTTFLHRLLVKDSGNFCSMRMWEILFAPSLVQRRLVRALVGFDRLMQRPVNRLRRHMEHGWRRRNVMHRVGLDEPEEDDYLLLHTWSALATGLSSGLLDQARPYAWFDQALPPHRRRSIMRFYRHCVQRHLHEHRAGRQVHYLAKNPALCPKLATLLEAFPDARIVYLARSPLEAVPSFVSMMEFSWQAAGVPADRDRHHRFLLDMMGHWYRYPLSLLSRRPPHTWAVVPYDSLVRDPAATVADLYQRLQLPLTARFRSVLEAEAQRARQHVSRHRYSPEAMGLSRLQVAREFQDVLEDFDSTPALRAQAADVDPEIRYARDAPE